MEVPPIRSLAGHVRTAAGVAFATLILFFLVEGTSSLLLVAHALMFRGERPLAERVHTRYDPTLGWVSLPNLRIPDMYGPGVFLNTNGQGFRNDRDFPFRVAEGKIRLVCSGDSFTLGYGVNNDQTWCQLLAFMDARLETVNMGQGGYGVDQAYLWYMRDGHGLDHQVHLFAFITDDFHRMGRAEFQGYGRPMMELSGGSLRVTHVPVPRRAFSMPWLTQNSRILARLKTLELLEKLSGGADPPTASSRVSDESIRRVCARIFESLREENRSKQSLLVLVYLPVWTDYLNDESGEWRGFVRSEAGRLGVPFIDLVEELRSLPREEARRLFRDHFTVEGNRFAAHRILARLTGDPRSPLHAPPP